MESGTKKIIMIVLSVLAGLVLLGAAAWWFYDQSKLTAYSHRNPTFTVQYPTGWKAFAKSEGDVFTAAFLSPKETAMDVMRENMNVTVQPVPDDIGTLSTFSQTIKDQMTAVFAGNIRIVSDKPVQMASGRRGQQMIFEAPNPNNLKASVTWTIRSGKAYIITFLATMQTYPQYAPLIERINSKFDLK